MVVTENFKNAQGEVINLRFDLGVARLVKQISGADLLQGANIAYDELGSIILAAAHQRYCYVHKQEQKYTTAELKEFFYEFDMTQATQLFIWFNESQKVKADPIEISKITEGGDTEKK